MDDRLEGAPSIETVWFFFSACFCEFYLGLSLFPVTVTTRIIPFLVGNPYKPSFATVTGRGDNPSFTIQIKFPFRNHPKNLVDIINDEVVYIMYIICTYIYIY